MRFLIDAQLPERAVDWLAAAGCDSMHVTRLPDGDRTQDPEIAAIADRDGRIVMTKDADFVDAHALHGRPARLLLISTGDVSNAGLKACSTKPCRPLWPGSRRTLFWSWA